MSLTTQIEHRRMEKTVLLDPKLQAKGRIFDPDASIILVGTRGCGKRSLGFIGATHLGRRLITEDHYFQEVTGVSRAVYVQQHGAQEFYKRNIDVARQMLYANRTGCIIECGMGSLATEVQRTLREYTKTNPVIYITRNSQRIRDMLNIGGAEATRLENADAAHRLCSNYEYYNLHDRSCDGMTSPKDQGLPNVSSKLKHAKEDFSAFLDFITGQGVIRNSLESPFSIAALPPECRLYTYALSIRMSSIPDLDLEQLESGADAVQIKVDTLSSPDIQRNLAKQVATVRRELGVPVILHAEEYAFEGMQLTISQKEDIYFGLLEHGLRLGVEYLVIDLNYSSDRVMQLVQSAGRTKVIGHYLHRSENSWGWDDESRMIQYRRAKSIGCDIVRFVRATSKASDNETVRGFLRKIDSIPGHLPVIAYNIGEHGRTSLIENRIFTPVTHPIMNSTVSKSQIRQFLTTAAEARQTLYQKSILDPLHFYHLGASVSYSLSPAMHNTAYSVCGMSNDFQSLQVRSVEEIHSICQTPDFGGAAITQPFKVQIMSRIVAKSYHAKAIGAVNTLLPLRAPSDNTPLDGTTQALLHQANRRGKTGPVCAYYGDNTDFIGIMTCLRRNISPRNVVQPSKTTGLVIGAGGMARAAIYAMIRLGCRKIFIFNRTYENAKNVADHFNSWTKSLSNNGDIVHVIRNAQEEWPASYRPPTMIVSCVPVRSLNGGPPANFTVPVQWLGSTTGGVVVELSYKPPLQTPLLNQIRRFREETKRAWVVVDGLEVLPEQAIAQFELMTGIKAPKRRMRMEVYQNYHKYEESN
ncbi:hypothetical protein CJF32_00010924 [Rutstroemia sp. NJR-2017a WRK4]|nr:hypothetical protein CJF32_00010924 [Rutstroemia sp. NJR-2017a WRK4]